MEKVYRENEGKPENEGNLDNEGRPEDEVQPENEGESNEKEKLEVERKSEQEPEVQNEREPDNERQPADEGKQEKQASLKLRETHSERASRNPRQSQRDNFTLLKSALLKIMCPGRQKEKRTGGQRIPPQTADSLGCGSRDYLFICTFPTKEYR